MRLPVLAGLAGLFAVATVAACGVASDNRTDDTGSAATASGLPCEVDRILERSCRGCHARSPVFGAPMPLLTHADLTAPARSDRTRKVYELLTERIADDDAPMPPTPNPRLSQADRDVLERWVQSGAAPSLASEPASCGGADGGGPIDPPELSCAPDVHMKPRTPWAMPVTSDDVYVCYGFDVTTTEKRHVVGIAPKIENASIVHHLLLFQATESMSGTPSPCSATLSTRWRLVYGWAPGGRAFEFPAEAGYPQSATTHYVVQVHYNNVLHRPGQTDASGFDFCTTNRLRPNDADMVAFGPARFSLPPRSTTDLTCDAKMPSWMPEVHLFAAFPHMHQLGTSIGTSRVRAGAAPEDLGGQASWDFQNQVYFPINGTMRGGDTIRTRCAWNNNRDSTVSFGEDTSDEMCFSFTMYWPRIERPQWSWMAPSGLASCRPTQ